MAEWDETSKRAWVHGPWVVGSDAEWAQWARSLFDAAARQIPATVVDREMSGTVANERLAALAAELGWMPTVTNHAYVIDADTAAAWPDGREGDGLRTVTAADLPSIDPLHEAEFPASYFTAAQLVERAGAGEQVVLVAEGDDGAFGGYVAGRVQPDGDGYLDFVAVDPTARGSGMGRRLIVELTRQVLPATTTGRVNLTVQTHRAAARSLYESLGFREDAAFRGYRSRSGG